MMRAVQFSRFGEPADVLRVVEVPVPEPGPGEVRVRMIASPVNPSDLLVVRGRYVKLPTPPATPGFEGVGIVDRAGPGLLGRLALGKRVMAINDQGGNWAEYAIIKARQARPIASDIPDEQAASAFVNPATVLALVRHVLAVPKGEWLLQSAANSSLGKMVIRLDRHDGIRTINVVRTREKADELLSLGADAVVVSGEGPIEDQVRQIVGTGGVRYALDPVGGAIGTGILKSLGKDGHLVIYGSLSEQPIEVGSRPMISGSLRVEGFWLGHWMRNRSIPQSLLMFRQIASLIRAGILATNPGPAYGLESIREAVIASEDRGTVGKVLLHCQAGATAG
jgi:NADPH:quinone reductase-like Zn-dependent oxidoreductase